MPKHEYFHLVCSMPTKWLLLNLADPSSGQRPIHLALIRLALRGRGL